LQNVRIRHYGIIRVLGIGRCLRHRVYNLALAARGACVLLRMLCGRIIPQQWPRRGRVVLFVRHTRTPRAVVALAVQPCLCRHGPTHSSSERRACARIEECTCYQMRSSNVILNSFTSIGVIWNWMPVANSVLVQRRMLAAGRPTAERKRGVRRNARRTVPISYCIRLDSCAGYADRYIADRMCSPVCGHQCRPPSASTCCIVECSYYKMI
jgi:hypothetical protein